MKGYEITFMAPRSRRHHGELVLDAVLRIAKTLGINRHTRRTDTESVGENDRSHSAHFFELADEPEELTFMLEDGKSDELMHAVEAAGLQVFCIRQPVEYSTNPSAPANPA
ncbi:PII-like signaling protein OS=Castellaniella defragrans OX=75697 GN=HNR28_000581 PE=3 SV=1 [Castellaniella defragrans]